VRRAFSKDSAVSILSRIVQRLDSGKASELRFVVDFATQESNALDLCVPLRDEILAFVVILANAFSRLRIGPHQNGGKLLQGFQVHAELTLAKRVIT
jgi:hypothetical protein